MLHLSNPSALRFGAFCPIFRLHGHRVGAPDVDVCATKGHNEVWSYGAPAYEAIAAVMRLREKLRPYIAEGLANATAHGAPLLRPMAYDCADTACNDGSTADQYMFGARFVVAPVQVYQAKARSVYLPVLGAGEQWVHFYSREALAAGTRHTVATTNLTEFPLFERVANIM